MRLRRRRLPLAQAGRGHRGRLAAARALRRGWRPAARRRVRELHRREAPRAGRLPRALSRDRARRTIRGRTGRVADDEGAGTGSAGPAHRAAGARARICRGSRSVRELVVEVAYDHMQGTRFRHTAQFRRWRPDKRRATARSRSSRWSRRRSWRRSLRKADKARSARRTLKDRLCRELFLSLTLLAALLAPFARRIVVGIGQFPAAGGSLPGHCEEFTRMRVQVDERPRIESTSTSSTARCFAASGCLCLPALEAGERGILVRRVGDDDQRHFRARLLAARFACDGATRGASPSILRKCGGQGASARPPLRHAPQARASASSEPAASSMPACGSPIAAKRVGHRQDREVGRVAVGNLVPGERRRDARVRQAGAPNRPSRSCGPWRSGCSRERRPGALPSTISRSRAPACAARSRARTPAPRASPR